MDDHRALQLLRDLTDHETARSTVDQDGELRYDTFSYDPQHYPETRRAIDARILHELNAQQQNRDRRRTAQPSPATW